MLASQQLSLYPSHASRKADPCGSSCASLHSFRFFGRVFIVPGVVGPNLPSRFATFAAYGDLATRVLAILALLTVRIHPVFWLFVVAFNLVGWSISFSTNATRVGLPALAWQLGAAYAIPIIYVLVLTITHFVAFYWLLRPQPKAARALAGDSRILEPATLRGGCMAQREGATLVPLLRRSASAGFFGLVECPQHLRQGAVDRDTWLPPAGKRPGLTRDDGGIRVSNHFRLETTLC